VACTPYLEGVQERGFIEAETIGRRGVLLGLLLVLAAAVSLRHLQVAVGITLFICRKFQV